MDRARRVRSPGRAPSTPPGGGGGSAAPSIHQIAFENTPGGLVLVLDRDGRVIAAGGTGTLAGTPPAEPIDGPVDALLRPDELARFEPAWREALAGNPVHRDGRLRGVEVEYWLQPVRDDQGAVKMVVVTLRDVTELRRVERELREERERLARVLDGSSDGYGELDLASGTCEVSRRLNEILGRDPAEPRMEWEALRALVHPDDLEAIRPEAEAVAAGELDRLDVEHRLRRADGAWVWVRTRAKVVSRDARGGPARLAGTLTDITRYRMAADERRARLEASEARYRGLHESLMDGYVLVDMDGVLRDWNEVYRTMLGYAPEELARLSYSELTPQRWHAEENRIVREQVLPRGYSDVYEKEYRRKDGSVFPVELRTFLLREAGRPTAMWAIVRDLTARNQLREQLGVATRLAALGTLVAGVAHEINNPLAAEIASEGFAIGAIEDLLASIHAGPAPDTAAIHRGLVEVLEALRDAQASGLRIAAIVKGMAAFARPETRRGRTSLAEVVEQGLQWLPAATRERVRVRPEDSGPVEISAPPGLLAQVVVNLVNNAAAATPAHRQGTVVIRSGPGPAGMAVLEVEDDGEGMTPEVLARIFDPFFSTRRPGPAIGLSLSIVHSVVTSLGGRITVRSEPGRGSTFRVELPALAPEEKPAATLAD